MDTFKRPISARSFEESPSSERLRELSRQARIPNALGISLFHSRIKSRSAAFTEIVYNPDERQGRTIEEARNSLQSQEMIHLVRNIGANQANVFRVSYTVPKSYSRLAYMMNENFFPPAGRLETEITVVQVPDWPERKVYVNPLANVTFILGSDYYGEAKMACLRNAMHIMREKRDGLGLHAGSKIYRILRNGKVEERGVLIFGLSGTGKTTITCSDHELKAPEGIVILQDDINMLCRDLFSFGTEMNFYVKTDNVTSQPDLLKAVKSPLAIAENVYVDEKGVVDFDNLSITSNGRCILPRRELRFAAEGIDLPRVDLILFNTRRFDIPPVGRLVSSAQAAAFLVLGESTVTSADDPARVGEARRVVAFDPFIVDNHHVNGNRFFEILEQHPEVRCYLVNTGKVGGVQKGLKITPEVTLKIVEGVVRGNCRWRYDPILGYDVPCEVPGVDVKRFDPYRFYTPSEYTRMIKDLREERLAFLNRFPQLYPEILKAL